VGRSSLIARDARVQSVCRKTANLRFSTFDGLAVGGKVQPANGFGVAYNRWMVVKSGNESIVLYNRGFTVTLRVLGWVLSFLALVLFGGALLGQIPWVMPLCFGVLAAFTAGLLLMYAREFSRGFVAFGPEGVRLGLLKFNAGDPYGFVRRYATWTPLPEQRYKWEEIGNITYDSDKGACRFRARNNTYELTDNNSPSPRTVARLMAERKGVQLPDQESLAPPGERPMPRMKQAKIYFGIGLSAFGGFAAGVWLASSQPGEIPGAAVGILVTLLIVGIGSIMAATTLVAQERSRRL
jgi:hypothetical protein